MKTVNEVTPKAAPTEVIAVTEVTTPPIDDQPLTAVKKDVSQRIVTATMRGKVSREFIEEKIKYGEE